MSDGDCVAADATSLTYCCQPGAVPRRLRGGWLVSLATVAVLAGFVSSGAAQDVPIPRISPLKLPADAAADTAAIDPGDQPVDTALIPPSSANGQPIDMLRAAIL
ncbi:MAG: hypothetical protein GY788_03250, partial [bacterium]|nr:hypothetical protein [bacterium]